MSVTMALPLKIFVSIFRRNLNAVFQSAMRVIDFKMSGNRFDNSGLIL